MDPSPSTLTETPAETISAFGKLYWQRLTGAIDEATAAFGPVARLRDSCRYALQSGGKRYRPLIVFAVAEALGHGCDVLEAALSVEFFHTASLIADDLPCMDDDAERRERPALHIAFDESTALLASYTLISAGYAYLVKNGERLVQASQISQAAADQITRIAVETTSIDTGFWGAISGQYLDLNVRTPNLEELEQIIEMKTSSLFRLAFSLGWLYGGGEISALPQVQRAANAFGMAFQLVDDLLDTVQDQENASQANMVFLCGKEQVYAMAKHSLTTFRTECASIGLRSALIEALCAQLELMAERGV